MKALVLGYGVSGQSAAAYLAKKGYEVHAADKKTMGGDIPIFKDDLTLDLSPYSLIVLSPGIPVCHPLIVKAQKQNIEIVGEIELACKDIKCPVIGITGTNGKTTVTLLIEHILKESGIKAKALGNVGIPLTSIDGTEEVVVLELSSYQLESLQTKILSQAVILNITPDHLDRYKTLEKYAEAKFLIQNVLKEGGDLLLQEKVVQEWGALIKRPFETYLDNPNHDLENNIAAARLVKKYGVEGSRLDQALKTFKKPPHRIEYVDEIQGVKFINDSKGTNIDATLRAVKSLEGSMVLIAGGVDKGFPYTSWIEPFKGKIKKIIAVGEASPKIERDLKDWFPVEKVLTLDEAVFIGFKSCERGETVLLSPGCASLDMFENYKHRGETFVAAVKSLKERP